MENLFSGLFDTTFTQVISVTNFLLCIGVAMIIGIILTVNYCYKNRYTKSFVLTLALIPSVVCTVIMMVNGNIGAGVAVAGAFSLVRFRSVAGAAKEIGMIFIAMAAGLITGMGYLAFAILFTLILCIFYQVFQKVKFTDNINNFSHKTMRITIPEDLDYSDVFNDLFNEYATNYEIINVKTSNLGSLYRLTYNLTLKDVRKEKEFIDALRCRNGNLEISVSRQETITNEL